jgi:hypothetical protein
VTEFLAALAGALIGGGATFWATWWQTRRMLDHERAMAHQALEGQRLAARQDIDSDAARELLPRLARVDEVLPLITSGGYLYMGPNATRVSETMAELRDLQHSTVALVSREGVREAWGQLRTLLTELAGARMIDGNGGWRLSEGWTQEASSRAVADVAAFAGYVRSHLLAVVDGTASPPSVNLPVLQRQDMSVWQSPQTQSRP